jgi:hypothetical protein
MKSYDKYRSSHLQQATLNPRNAGLDRLRSNVRGDGTPRHNRDVKISRVLCPRFQLKLIWPNHGKTH